MDACINEVIYSKKSGKCDIGLMIKVIYSKKSGKCDIGRINDKGDIFKEVRKMRYYVLMIKVIYSKKSGKCDIGRLN